MRSRSTSLYRKHRFPPEIISHPVWLYHRFLSVHSPINNLFRVGRHLIKATHYRLFRDQVFTTWHEVTTEQYSYVRGALAYLTLREVCAWFE